MLYLGLDIESNQKFNTNYSKAAIELIKIHLKEIIGTMNSCKTIFDEKDISGMVIGIKWTNFNQDEAITIWIDKDDVLKFEENKLTMDELIQRSTITNTTGKIIRLLI